MKPLRWILPLVAVVGLAGLTCAADEAKTVTVSGNIACAKCTLHAEGVKDCQNVLVADQGGTSVQYYIAKNDVSKAFEHVCKGEKGATVTGTVAEKDGKTWLTPTKMEPKAEPAKS